MEEYGPSVDVQETLSYPKPGTFVPKELQAFLDSSYSEINECEYKSVALEVEDPALNDYTEEDTGDDVETDLDPTYLYVHIVRKVGSDVTVPLLQEYEIDDGTENLHTVRAYHLYKFDCKKKENDGKKEDNIETQLVGNARDTPKYEVKDNSQPLSLKTAYREISVCLKEAWKQPVEKRKIVKRLLLKWHPDQNPSNVEFFANAFKCIQQCLRRLDKGLDLIDDDAGDVGSQSDFDSSSSEDYWASSCFGLFWERHEKRSSKSKIYDEFDGAWNTRGTFFAKAEPKPYHYHVEARRWQRQAKSDLDNSTISLKRKPNNSFNWVCYMAHQAAEKSMKAAWYAKDANQIHAVRYSHNLNSIASGLGSDIINLARTLNSLTGEHTRMRYPDAFYGQQVPEKAFNIQTTQTVVSVAKQIIDTVHRTYIR